MADYYPLIARAVNGLEKSTGEARRALYERARTALVTQLRGVEPVLSEADITRERLALEEAIRKVEGEAARRPRLDVADPPRPKPPPVEEPPSPAPPPPPPPPPPEKRFEPPPPPPPEQLFEPQLSPPPADWDQLRRELDGLAKPIESEPTPTSDIAPREDEPPLPLGIEERPQLASPEEGPPQEAPSQTPRRPEKRFSGQHNSIVDEGLKGFRDVMAETEDLGDASASAAKAARQTREAFANLPPTTEVERIEPRVQRPRDRPVEPHLGEEIQEFDAPPERPERAARREQRRAARGSPVPPPMSVEEFEEPQEEEEEQRLRRGFGRFIPGLIAILAILVLAGAAFYAWREWGSSIMGMMQASRAPTTQAAKEPQPSRPKISDRVGGAQQDTTARPATGAGAAVAQRAVLYEQGTSTMERKQYVGSVIWRTEATAPGPGQAPDTVLKGEIEIPERQIRGSVTLRRNLDQSLPVSHTLEILFSTPADFQPGGVARLIDVVVQDANQTRVVPLQGTGVKVTSGFFLLGLSSAEVDMRRNMSLLKDGSWILIRVAYNNGQAASLALEKGVPGDRAFEDALKAWGQMPASAQQP
jgi:hypothetical protein